MTLCTGCESHVYGEGAETCEVCFPLDYATRIERAVQQIRELGYSVRFVEYCEDAETPGLLGQIAGATCHARRDVKLATRPSLKIRAEAAEHELLHVQDPSWDCGNRDVFGRGGSQ